MSAYSSLSWLLPLQGLSQALYFCHEYKAVPMIVIVQFWLSSAGLLFIVPVPAQDLKSRYIPDIKRNGDKIST